LSATITVVMVSDGGETAVQLRREGAGYAVADVKGDRSASASVAGAGGEVVVGLAGGDVAYYGLELPGARPEQMGEMVRLQAEALVPLPVEALQLAWRGGRGVNGKMQVTLAAARRERVRTLLEEAGAWKPTVAAPASEGLVWGGRELFGWGAQSGALLYVGGQGSELCVVRGGELVDAVRLEVGEEALWEGQQLVTAQAQRLSQDLRAAMAGEQVAAGQVWLASPGDERFAGLVSFLREHGWSATVAEPAMERLTSAGGLSRRWAYERAGQLGLALGALAGPESLLNLAAELRGAEEEVAPRWALPSLQASGVVLGVMVALFAVAGYVTDRAELARAEATWAAVQTDTERTRELREQALRQAVARRRVDPLEVIALANGLGPKGFLLDGVEIDGKGQVTIRGQLGNEKEFFEYQEALQGQAGASKVRGKMEGEDKKTKKQKFSVTLAYEPAGHGEVE